MTDEGLDRSYEQYCAALDAYGESVQLGCSMMRAMLTMRGHAEAFEGLGVPGKASRLTGPAAPDLLTPGAERLLGRCQGDLLAIGRMPGLREEDLRRIEAL